MSEAVQEVKRLIEHQGECWDKFKSVQDKRFDNIEDELRSFRQWQLEATTPGSKSNLDNVIAPLTDEDRAAFKIKIANGDYVPTIGKSTRVADFFSKNDNEDNFSIGSYVRNNILLLRNELFMISCVCYIHTEQVLTCKKIHG